jgi:hypothetical protein
MQKKLKLTLSIFAILATMLTLFAANDAHTAAHHTPGTLDVSNWSPSMLSISPKMREQTPTDTTTQKLVK